MIWLIFLIYLSSQLPQCYEEYYRLHYMGREVRNKKLIWLVQGHNMKALETESISCWFEAYILTAMPGSFLTGSSFPSPQLKSTH